MNSEAMMWIKDWNVLPCFQLVDNGFELKQQSKPEKWQRLKSSGLLVECLPHLF